MELSNKIRKYRFENNEMTQKQLAELVGVSRQTMNAIENCKHAPTIDVAIRIADVLGVSVDQMFRYDYDGKPERRLIETTVMQAQPVRSAEGTLDVPASRGDPGDPHNPRGRGSVTEEEKHEFSLADLRNMF